MVRRDALVHYLAAKRDTLTDPLASLAFLFKKRGTPAAPAAGRGAHGARGERNCSFCRKPGYGVNRYPGNPDREMRCPRCRKMGRLEGTSWARRKDSSARVHISLQSDDHEDACLPGQENDSSAEAGHVVMASYSHDEDNWMEVKRDSDDLGIHKQPGKEVHMPMRDLRHPKRRVRAAKLTGRWSERPKGQAQKGTKPQFCSDSARYDLLSELANVHSGTTLRRMGRLRRSERD